MNKADLGIVQLGIVELLPKIVDQTMDPMVVILAALLLVVCACHADGWEAAEMVRCDSKVAPW